MSDFFWEGNVISSCQAHGSRPDPHKGRVVSGHPGFIYGAITPVPQLVAAQTTSDSTVLFCNMIATFFGDNFKRNPIFASVQ